MSFHDKKDVSRRAASAAAAVGQHFVAAPITPVVLRHSQHVIVLLRPAAIVARVLSLSPTRTAEALSGELEIVRHVGERGASVVMPSHTYPAGPHFHDGFAMTLWPYVEHHAIDDDDSDQLASAARALRQVHEALADLPHSLPSYLTKIEECGALLGNRSELPALATSDRDVLLEMYEKLTARLARCPTRQVPIHGDAHLGNVLFAPDGPRWTDFEAVCLGPREWDICEWVPDLAVFEPINRECHEVLSLMRSLCVSTWCWASPHLPGKLDAANYHLNYLRSRLLL
jgi:aminoglycoside phosphotransferase (APT) family kinase protein